MDNKLEDLCAELQPIARAFLNVVNAAIAPSICRITTTWRDAADQNHDKSCGLSKASFGGSPHNCTLNGLPAAKAFDWSILNPDGSYVADGTDNRYSIAGHIAEGLGLEWGATFAKPDYDHAQLADWKAN